MVGTDYRGTNLFGFQLIIALYLGIPAVIYGTFKAARYRSTGKAELLHEGGCAFSFVLSLAGLALTVPVGKKLLARDVAHAKAYCDGIAKSEKLRPDKNGDYPKKLGFSNEETPLPRLLRNKSFDQSSGQFYQFSIKFGFDLRWDYDSRHGSWILRS